MSSLLRVGVDCSRKRQRNREAAAKALDAEQQRRVAEDDEDRRSADEESRKSREEGVATAVKLAEEERERRVSESSRSESTPSLASQSGDSPSKRVGGPCDRCGKITTIRCSRCKIGERSTWPGLGLACLVPNLCLGSLFLLP